MSGTCQGILFPLVCGNPNFYHLCERSLLKTLCEIDKMLVTSIFSFSHNFFYHSKKKNIFISYVMFILSTVSALSLDKSKIWLCGDPFPNNPWFLRVCSIGLLKTLWEKGKLLVTSNFSFSHSFLPFWRTCNTFIKLKIVICKLFRF